MTSPELESLHAAELHAWFMAKADMVMSEWPNVHMHAAAQVSHQEHPEYLGKNEL
jgi:hypothetical protein